MSGGVPAGWVLVPVEPTEAMYEAGYDATRLADGTPQFADAGFCLGHSGNIYRAMIAATPTPPPSRDADVERDVSLAEAARDLLEAQKRLGPAVAFRLDLWACLEAILEGQP